MTTKNLDAVLGKPEEVILPTQALPKGNVDPISDEDLVDEDPPQDGEALVLPDAREVKLAKANASKLHRTLKTLDQGQKQVLRAAKQAQAVVGTIMGSPAVATKPVEEVPREVARLLPERDRFKLYKRELGKLVEINTYTRKEIEVDGSVESFINARIRPQYGDYDYLIYTIDSNGVEKYHTTSSQRNMNMPDSSQASVSVLRDMFNLLKEERLAMQQQGKQPSSTFEDMSKLLSTMQGNQKLDPIMLMMLPMLRDAMASMTGSSSDKVLLDMVDKMLARLETLEKKSAEPMLTAPPPVMMTPEQPDPTKMLVTVLEALQKQQQQNPLMDAFKQLGPLLSPMLPAILDALTGKAQMQQQLAMQQQMFELKSEMIKLQTQQLVAAQQVQQVVAPQQGLGGLREFREQLQDFKILAAELAPREAPMLPPQPMSSEFWSFLGNAIVTLPQTISALSKLRDQGQDGAQGTPAATMPAQPSQSPPKPMPELPGPAPMLISTLNRDLDEDELLATFIDLVVALAESRQWKPLIQKLLEGAVEAKDLVGERAERAYSKVGNVVDILLNALEKRCGLTTEAANKLGVVIAKRVSDLVGSLNEALEATDDKEPVHPAPAPGPEPAPQPTPIPPAQPAQPVLTPA